MSDHRYALGVVGTGHIALILVERLIASGYLAPERIIVSPSRKLEQHRLPVRIARKNEEVVRDARIVLLSVTPQTFVKAAESIRSDRKSTRLNSSHVKI